MHARRILAALGAGVVASAMLIAAPTAAFAVCGTTACATFTGAAGLTLTAPSLPTFTATLAGTAQNVTQPQVFLIADNGLGAGWNITTTSTFFTTGVHVMATGSVTVQALPASTCTTAGCITATNSGIVYPYTFPDGTTAPTATKMINASAGTGMGNTTSSGTMQLAVPAASYAGNYTSTWTYSMVSGP